jgi:hypothetical protein
LNGASHSRGAHTAALPLLLLGLRRGSMTLYRLRLIRWIGEYVLPLPVAPLLIESRHWLKFL